MPDQPRGVEGRERGQDRPVRIVWDWRLYNWGLILALVADGLFWLLVVYAVSLLV